MGKTSRPRNFLSQVQKNLAMTATDRFSYEQTVERKLRKEKARIQRKKEIRGKINFIRKMVKDTPLTNYQGRESWEFEKSNKIEN